MLLMRAALRQRRTAQNCDSSTLCPALQPTYTIPTVVASKENNRAAFGFGLEDLGEAIGEDAIQALNSGCSLTYPIRQGIVG